jgi:ornithine carbamoyltransferase
VTDLVLGTLRGRSLTRDADLTAEEFLALVDFAIELRNEKRAGVERARLTGRTIALIFEKASTRTRSAFEVAAYDQGAHVTYLGPNESQLGHKESVKDTARVLGRLYHGIEFRGYAQDDVETLAREAGVPVWNGLTDTWHPTQLLADVMTMREAASKPLAEVRVAYVGDARNNTASSLIVVAGLLGLDLRVGCPATFAPSSAVREVARVHSSPASRLTVTEDLVEAVAGVDFIYTDVWLSMGEPSERWGDRVAALTPFQVNSQLVARAENPHVRFLHCLPALHNTQTEVGRELAATYGIDAVEVTDEVFESPASIVFEQAENRLHTIKALMVATLGAA